jgi:hypothetical protein
MARKKKTKPKGEKMTNEKPYLSEHEINDAEAEYKRTKQREAEENERVAKQRAEGDDPDLYDHDPDGMLAGLPEGERRAILDARAARAELKKVDDDAARAISDLAERYGIEREKLIEQVHDARHLEGVAREQLERMHKDRGDAYAGLDAAWELFRLMYGGSDQDWPHASEELRKALREWRLGYKQLVGKVQNVVESKPPADLERVADKPSKRGSWGW